MKFRILFFTLVFVGFSQIWSQSSTEPNEGSKLEYDDANSIWRFKWWGREGRTYFIQHSDNLLNPWQWVPIIESGNDSVREWGFTTTGDKFFLRLHHTDVATSDPEGDDFDGDGIGNLAEVQQGLSPFKIDSDGDGMPDGYELANGLNSLIDDTLLDLDGDLIANGEDARPNDGNFGRVTVSISAPIDGATIP